MPQVARLNDLVEGATSGEHSGHDEFHGSLPIVGFISDNCSPNVFINNLPAAFVGSITEEHDSCCGSSNGTIAEGSPNVFVNGIPISRVGDALNAHNGTGFVSSGSPNVFAN